MLKEDIELLRTGTIDEAVAVIEKLQTEIVQAVLLALPQVAINLLRYGKNISESIATFYEDNPDMVKYKDIIAQVAEVVEADNPGAPVSEILDKVKSRLQSETNINVEDMLKGLASKAKE